MYILFNDEKLSKLIASLYTLTGIQTNICDISGQSVRLLGSYCEFCGLINSSQEGHRRCLSCAEEAAEKCARLGKTYKYKCHAGLLEVIVPIFDNSEPVAFIIFSQLPDDSPKRLKWEEACGLLSWYTGDMSELEAAFALLDRCPKKKSDAYENVLETVTSYIRLEGIVRSAEFTDRQKLEMYIDQHYTEKLSLKKISDDLCIGTTKLCALAKEVSPGSTVTKLITRRRIDAAKLLLTNERHSVAEISEKVGFSDYNYFTKNFRKLVGVTPTEYRKLCK